ncbi:hypothetical protein [Pseudomonas haemolytica]|uniref:Uncharacterized protein n=1 Tax=Pseudomonas haemolytica TaxID=2600065 RepID=A0ABS1GQ95_9PSED|nr:hypothetical protein [Pseudomonas haemolytica]MBK3459144.1 hypothetical protein [Pseudomonas haemolytica]
MPTEIKAAPFDREERYIVLKLKRLPKDEVEYLRDCHPKAMVECVVVENDWPEYHLVWAMLEHRMAGKPVPNFNDWRRADELQQRLTAADERIDELTAPAGYCLMPTSLTAENGAKALLMGEFSVSQQHVCPECATTGEAPDDDCDICEGLGSYTQHTPISWDTMKEIYSKVVGSLAKTPNTPQ